jgi:hypothetical protein
VQQPSNTYPSNQQPPSGLPSIYPNRQKHASDDTYAPSSLESTYVLAEDPVIWYSGGQYHVLYDYPDDRVGYHLTSTDGIHNWTDQGFAFDPRMAKQLFSTTDGTVDNWYKMERPGVVMENGHITHFTFAVSDVDKNNQITANSNHGSKVLVMQFDGVTFDAETGIGGGSGSDGGSGSAGAGGHTGAGGIGGGGGAPGSGGATGGNGGTRSTVMTGSGGVGGKGGSSSDGGISGGGVTSGNGGASGGGGAAGAGGTGGNSGSGGRSGSGGASTTGGATGTAGAGGQSSSGGTVASGGATSSGGAPSAGGTTAAGGGVTATGGAQSSGAGGSRATTDTAASASNRGCSCAIGSRPVHGAHIPLVILLVSATPLGWRRARCWRARPVPSPFPVRPKSRRRHSRHFRLSARA